MGQVATPRETAGNRLATQENLARAAQDLFSADFCAVQAVNPITERLYADAVILGNLPGNSSADLVQARLKSLANQARQQVGLYVEDLANSPEAGETMTAFSGLSTVAAIAFHTKREKKPMVVLILGYLEPPEFNKIDQDVLKLFVDQWSLVLENVWLLGRYREVVKIGQEINQTLKKPHDLFEQLFENVSTILDTKYFFMLAIYHQPNETIDYHMAYRGQIAHSEGQPLKLRHSEGETFKSGCAFVIETKEPLVEANRSEHPNPQVELETLLDPDQPDPESLIFVPLIFRGEPLGVLSIQQLHPNAFDDEDLHIITLLGNQAALAISDLRLFGYLEDLNEAGQHLTSQLTSETMLASVVERIWGSTQADIIMLYPYVQDPSLPVEMRFGRPHLSGKLNDLEHVRETVRNDDIACLALENLEPVWAEDSGQLFVMLGGHASARKGTFEKRESVLSTAVLPLRIEGEVVGVLFINYRHTQLFKATQRNLILGLANFAAIAISNNRRFNELSRRRLEELEVLRQIDLEISGSLNLKEVLNTILKHATQRVGGDEASVFLINPYAQQLETEVSVGRSQEQYQRLSMPVNGKGLVPWVFNNKVPVRVGNVKTDADWKDIYEEVLKDTKSELDVPLKEGEEVIGVINLESTRESAFSAADQTFLVTLAGQAVLAIRNSQIYERAEAGKRSREILHKVAKEIIAQQGDPERVIRIILQQARHLIGAEIGFFQQYENGQASKFYVDPTDKWTENSFLDDVDFQNGVNRIELGIISRVAATRQPYTTVGIDAQDDPLYKGSRNVHSELAVPLLTQDADLIGVLDLESPRPFAFDEDDQDVLDLFGGLAVIAIKNARDYSRAKDESEHAKIESTRFRLLWEAGQELGEISDTTQLEAAYDIVIREVGEFSDGEVVIRRFDTSSEELILARVGKERQTPPLQSIPKSQGVNGQVARELKTIQIDDLDNPPSGIAQPIGDDPSIKSLVVTPLIFERAYYGNLVLSTETAFSLSEADISLLKGLARQLAITIHRLEIAKATKEAEQHARDLSIMSEFGQSGMEIAHRLGNVLGSVATYISNIRKIIREEEIEHPLMDDDLTRVESNVKALLSMANGLRQRIPELGKLEKERSVVPVKALLEDAAWSLHVPENIKLDSQLEDDLPDVSIVYGQVIDILRNLVINSIEAMQDGGTIIVRASYERGQFGNPSQHVQIEVRDTGPGIPSTMQSKVFNLFFSTKKSSGFGLWSARQYARANGGDLTLISGEGKGVKFTLTLPVALKHEVVP